MVNLYSFPQLLLTQANLSFSQVSHSPPPSHTEQLPKPLSLDISTIALVCIVSEPCLDKSEEFNNHSFLELFLVSYRAFLSQKKTIKADRLFINLF